MNLQTVLDLNISSDKKKFLTRPDFQAQFSVWTVDKDTGTIVHDTKSSDNLYSALKEHFHALAVKDYCNLMYLLDVDTYNNLTVFWAKNEEAVANSLKKVELLKSDLGISQLVELNRFLLKLFSHPEQSLIN